MIYIKCSHCGYQNLDRGVNFKNESCIECGLSLVNSDRILDGNDIWFCVIMGMLIGASLCPLGGIFFVIGTIMGGTVGYLVYLSNPPRVIK